MNTVDPNEAVQLIRTKAYQFAIGDADDPKDMVDGVLAEIVAVSDSLGGNGRTYVEKVSGGTKMLLAGSEADEPALSQEVDDPRSQRSVRFLRSIAQLLDAQRAVGS